MLPACTLCTPLALAGLEHGFDFGQHIFTWLQSAIPGLLSVLIPDGCLEASSVAEERETGSWTEFLTVLGAR